MHGLIEIGQPIFLQVLNFAIVTLENFLPVLHIAKILTEGLKAA